MSEILDENFSSIIILIISTFILYHGISFFIQLIRKKRFLKKLAKSGIKEIDQMDGIQFEYYLEALFKEIGYRPEVTKGSHDFGADLIMKKNGKKIVIQAKRYGYKNNVSLDAVQQIHTAKTYYKADEAWVVTNSMFTKSAKKLASGCGVILYDREKLVEFINQVNPSVTASQVVSEVEPESRKCKVCGGELVRRKSNKGNFFMGCSNFPQCRHTEKIAN